MLLKLLSATMYFYFTVVLFKLFLADTIDFININLGIAKNIVFVFRLNFLKIFNFYGILFINHFYILHYIY